MKRILALLLTTALLVTGCGVENGGSDGEQVLQSADGQHAITIPGNWRDEEDRLNPVAVLAASNRKEEQYVIVLLDNRENLAVIYPDFDLEQYSGYIVQSMSEKMGDPVVGEPENLLVDGFPAVLTEFSGSIKNAEITYWVYCLEQQNTFVQLIGWTTTDRAEKSRELIEGILTSYTFEDEGMGSSSEESQPPVQKV